MSFVYVIREMPRGTDDVLALGFKIGVSDAPWKRRRDLQTSSSRVLHGAAQFQIEPRKRAEEWERLLLTTFNPLRVNGAGEEWHQLSFASDEEGDCSVDLLLLSRGLLPWWMIARVCEGFDHAGEEGADALGVLASLQLRSASAWGVLYRLQFSEQPMLSTGRMMEERSAILRDLHWAQTQVAGVVGEKFPKPGTFPCPCSFCVEKVAA